MSRFLGSPRHQPEEHSHRLVSLGALAVGLAFLLVVFRTLLDPSKILAIGDLAFFHLPLRTLLREALAEGVPWWNAALNGGQPILSNPNYAAFYPPNWLAFAVPVAWSIHIVLLLHAGWALAGAWRLARFLGCRPSSALLAAVGFAAGGAFVSSATLLTLFCGLAWMPWILLWAGRTCESPAGGWQRSAVLVAFGLAAQFLAGEPVICMLSGVALLGLTLDRILAARPAARRLAVAVVLSLALAGIQLLPTFSRLADSPRAGGVTGEAATERSLPPARFLEWSFPHPFGDPMRFDERLFFGQTIHDNGFPYLISIYPGLLIALLAIGGIGRADIRWRWVWLTMIAGGIFLALGRHNPLYETVVLRLPIFEQARYPEKLLLLATSALPFAAALSWEARLGDAEGAFGRRGGEAGRHRLDLPFLLGLIAALLLGTTALLLAIRPEGAIWLATTLLDRVLPPELEAQLMTWARREIGVAFVIAALACVLLRASRRGARLWLGLAMLGLVAFDLGRATSNLLPVVPTSAVTSPDPILEGRSTEWRLFTDLMFSPEAAIPLRSEQDGPSFLWHGLETLEPYVATLWGFSYALNHDYDLMLTDAARRTLETFAEDWDDPVRAWQFAGAWSVGTIARHRDLETVLRQRLKDRPAPRLRLETNHHWLAEYRIVPRVELHADQDAAIAAARASAYRFDEIDHWVDQTGGEPREPQTAPRTQASAELEIVSDRWSSLRFHVTASSPAYLQVARSWDRHWSCRLNGEPAPVHLTALGQMGVVLPAGETEIELTYFDAALPAGALVSLAGLLLATFLWRRSRRSGLG